MVARNGNPKVKGSPMSYTLIGDDFSIHNMSADKLAAAINDKKAVVTNLAVTAKGLVSTNGAMDKYTTIGPDGQVIGVPRVVILNRVETNNKLSGYIVFNTNGFIGQMTVPQAAELAANGLIANGKIRHTAEGDIVAAIGGNYPLIEHQINTAPDKADKPTVDLVLFGSALKSGKTLRYAGVVISSKNARTLANMSKALNTANAKLIDKLVAGYGYDAEGMGSYKLRQYTGAAVYGVYPMETITKLLETGKVKCSLGKLIVSCLDCNEADAAESIAIYDTKKKAVVSSQEGTEKSDARLKKYIAEVAEKL